MTVETPQPQPDDRVRVSFEADYWAVQAPQFCGRPLLDIATVEVLERADDPTVGEIRRVSGSLDGESKRAVKVGAFLSTNPAERFMWVIVETGEMLADGDVSGLGEVIGAVPDSPAAKAQRTARPSVRVPNEPHGPSEHVRQMIREHLQGGDAAAAVDLLVQRTTMDRKTAARYIQDMPEYQTYLNRSETREPRVFWPGIDGVPEPDDDIDVVEDKHGDRLTRVADGGWIGDGGDGYPRIQKDWENHFLAKYAPYTEVLS